MKLTTHIHLVPVSRMRGAIPPFRPYAFMAWCSVKMSSETTLPFCISLTSKEAAVGLYKSHCTSHGLLGSTRQTGGKETVVTEYNFFKLRFCNEYTDSGLN